MCVFLIGDFCITTFQLMSAGTVLVVIVLVVIVVVTKNSDTSTTDNDGEIVQTIPPSNSEEASDDGETPTPKVGKEVPFDTIEDMTCRLIVTEVNDDDEEVHGKFAVELPFGATNIDPHYDSENDEVVVEYDLGTSHGLEVYFDVAEPMDEDALAGYSWTVDSVEAEAKPA